MYPPFDFPLYGLDGAWTGPRWLDFFEGEVGKPSWGAWLGHGHTADRKPDSPWVIMGSFSVRRSVETQLQPSESFEHYLASIATLVLFNDSVEAPARLETEPERWSAWQSASFSADGQPISAQVLNRGDAWAGFTTGLHEVGLVIHANRIAAEELALAEVTSSSSYHFNSDEPLVYADVLHASRTAAFEN